MQPFSFHPSATCFLTALTLTAGISIISGCQSKTQEQKTNQNLPDKEINLLKLRLKKLESQLNPLTNHSISESIDRPVGPIKSITFRFGTKDDRLRIYWKNDKKTDLPCTKEQSIWVCG